MDIVKLYQEYLKYSPTIIFYPGMLESNMPEEIKDILAFDKRTRNYINIEVPQKHSKFVCRTNNWLTGYELNSETYWPELDKCSFSKYLLNYLHENIN